MTSLLNKMDHGDMVAAVDAWFESCRGKREVIPTSIGIALQVVGTMKYGTKEEIETITEIGLPLLGLDQIKKRAQKVLEPKEWLIA